MQLCSNSPRCLAVKAALFCTLASHSVAAKDEADLIRGISYGPLPVLSKSESWRVPEDDWMFGEAITMWGRRGRGDLRIIRQLGANMVRLYGNNPEHDHGHFLDTALREGLRVAAGMSDYPYVQMPGNCMSTDFDCFDQVRPRYAKNLARGFLTSKGQYHGALKFMNLINEPDLKLPATVTTGGPEEPRKMAKALISALDAMLEAEKDLGVTGPLINFTVTMSYSTCESCVNASTHLAVAQMAQFRDAVLHPELYNYVPRNNLTEAYKTRFTNSFNTANRASDLPSQVLDAYEALFPSTPVYIAEFHSPGINQAEDLHRALKLAKERDYFLGVSFFQFQVAYWKDISFEMEFGMFGLDGSRSVGNMPYGWSNLDIFCLQQLPNPSSSMSLSAAVASVYGGHDVDVETLCAANPWAVSLDEAGFKAIAEQGSLAQMSRYVVRVVEHLGATVTPSEAESRHAPLEKFAQRFLKGGTFAELVDEFRGTPSWMEVDRSARCVASRDAHPREVGAAIGLACSQAQNFTCESIPATCKASTYAVADYVFSRLFEEQGDPSNPIASCNIGGVSQYASSALYLPEQRSTECVLGASSLLEHEIMSPPSFPMMLTFDHLEATRTITTTTRPRSDQDLKCLANRSASADDLSGAIGWACGNVRTFSCGSVFEECTVDLYRMGDWVFSRYFEEQGIFAKPSHSCSFNGAAEYVHAANVSGAAGCAVGIPDDSTEAATTVTTSTMSPEVDAEATMMTTATPEMTKPALRGSNPQTFFNSVAR